MANDNDVIQKILSIRVDYGTAIKNIADYQRKLEGLRDTEKQLTQQYKVGRISRDEYHKQVAAIKEATKEYQTEIRLLSKEVQDNIKFEKSQLDSVNALRAALARQKAEYYELSKAQREGSQGKALQSIIKETNDEIKAAEESIGVFSRNVGNYENAIKNALGMNNTFANSLLNMTKSGDGIKGMFGEAKKAAGAFLSTLSGFLTNPIFLSLAGIMGAGAVFKWWFDYNMGLAEATKLTKEFLNLNGTQLQGVRNEIQAIADVYGKDFKDVLSAVDNLVSQYGLTAEQALSVVKDGFQAGADEGGKMLDLIQKYSAVFHDAGVSADEMMAIITQTRSGIFSESGLEVISMASKRIREMSSTTEKSLDAIGISGKQVEADLTSGAKSTFDVIQEISAQLRQMPQDSQAVGDVLNNVFGRQGATAGLQMIEQLDTMTKSIEEVKAVTGEEGAAMREQVKAQTELNNVTSAMFDATDKGFKTITIQAKTYIIEGLVSMGKWVIDLANKFIELYNKAWTVRLPIQAIVVAFNVAWNVIKGVFKLIGDVISDTVKSLMGLGEVIHGVFTLDWNMIKSGAKNAAKGVGELLTDVVKDSFNTVKDSVVDVVDGVKATISKANVPPIVIPVTSDGVEIPGVNKASTSSQQLETKSDGGSTGKGKSNANKNDEAEERRHQEELAKILAEGEEKLLALITSNLARQRAAITAEYNKQIAELKYKLDTEKKLTAEAKKNLNDQIVSLEQDKQKKLKEFDDERIKALADTKSAELAKEIELTQKGTEKRLSLVKQQINQEYSIKLSEQDKKIKEQQDYLLSLAAEQAKAIEEGRSKEEIDAIGSRMDTEEELLLAYANQREQLTREQNDKLREAQEEFDDEALQRTQQRYENEINELMLKDDRTQEEQERVLELEREKAEQRLAELEERGVRENETLEEHNAEIIQAKQDLADAEKNIQEYESEIEQAKLEAASTVTGSLIKLTAAIGESNTAFAKMSKILTLAQIAIDTGKALSAGIASASSLPFPANLAAIATTVATVIANIATAISTVNSAKFARGGIVDSEDPKNKEDKVIVRVNKGEMILNEEEQANLHKQLTGRSGGFTQQDQKELFGLANGTIKYSDEVNRALAPLTSSFSEIGSVVPINSRKINDSVAAEAGMVEQMSDAIENMPAPVVSVEDINDGQRRVNVIENIDTL